MEIEIGKRIEDLERSLNKLKKPVGELGMALGIVVGAAEKMAQTIRPFTQVQDAAANLAKTIGLSNKSILATAYRTVELNTKMQHSMSYNISNQQMLELQGSIMSRLQRNVSVEQVERVNGEIVATPDTALENLIAASKVFGEGNVAEIVAGYDKLGISMKTAAQATGKLYKEAVGYGINLQKYTENFTSNLEMAQMYNFRNGVNGLREMARKATEIRQDMRQIATFADKVGTVTGAVETAANLQVLGGSFAALSNPLAMLNESLTDMEGLQDRFNKMSAGAASYNSVTHQIEMDPVTRQIMKRAAQSMGVDPNNFIDQAYAQARRGEIERQINVNGIGGIDDDLKTLLSNVGEINSETGLAGATIGGDFRTLAEIASHPELQKQLIEETQRESEDIKTIAKNVMTITDKVAGYREQATNEAARNMIRPGAISGFSAYEVAAKALNEKFTPDVLTAAGNLDAFSTSLQSFWDLMRSNVDISLVKVGNAAVNASTPEEARKMAEKGSSELLGNSELAKSISSAFGSLVGELNRGISGINEITKTGGLDIQPRKLDSTSLWPTLTGSSASMGGAIPVTLTATSDGASTSTAPVISPTTATAVSFAGNEQSIPGAQVASTKGGSTTNGAQAQQGGSGGNPNTAYTYNLNLSGNLTMDINGDNGKIGTADIMKLIQNNPSFARELAKAMAESLAKINAAGMNHNP